METRTINDVIFPAYVIVDSGFTSARQMCATKQDVINMIEEVEAKEESTRLSYAVEVEFIYHDGWHLTLLRLDSFYEDEEEDEVL